MLYLAFIFHMHQPYYVNLLTKETELPWVRLHGIKDYLDMVEILKEYPKIHQTFNLVPSLIEQIEDYTNCSSRDKYLELSYKPANTLTDEDKHFILENFFKINKDRVIMHHPRYYELHQKKNTHKEFSTQDYLDLQVWFNLAWTDPYFRECIPELRKLIAKARFFTEKEKCLGLDKQIQILKDIVPTYKHLMDSGQIEVSLSPYYHPILPLLCNTDIAREANHKTILPEINFSFPEDAKKQIDDAVGFYQSRFQEAPLGMWPSEEAVSQQIIPFIIEAGINWIVSDEAILFKSMKKKHRDTHLLYQPHFFKANAGQLNIIFRDKNLSDLIGFVYHNWKPDDAVKDFMQHLENTAAAFKDEDILVTIAMDGENAWEYYRNDGHDFLKLLYQRLSESKTIKTVTVSEYLERCPAHHQIRHLACGSWIYGDFGKWMGNNRHKVKAWEWLARARQELVSSKGKVVRGEGKDFSLAMKQMYILEGSDWFWWYGEDDGTFDRLFRMHLSNFYTLLGKDIPEYLTRPLTP